MKHHFALLVVFAALLACRQDITSATSGMGAPAAYPTGDAVEVYRVVVAEILKHGRPNPTQIVLSDHTSSWTPVESYNAAKIWVERSQSTRIDSTLLADAIANTSVTSSIRPDFLVGKRAVLVSAAELRALHEREIQKEKEAVKSGRFQMGFWLAFYEAHPGAPGLINLSRVGFNRAHTQAAIDYVISCGDLCATGGFMLLARTAQGWSVTTNRVEWMS